MAGESVTDPAGAAVELRQEVGAAEGEKRPLWSGSKKVRRGFESSSAWH
jgi:hypothetical protein